MNKKDNYYKVDDVFLNSLFGYDYSFCGSDCVHYECGRNMSSKSHKSMIEDSKKTGTLYSICDFSNNCCNYWKKRRLKDDL